MEGKVLTTITALKQNGFGVEYFETGSDLKVHMLSNIDATKSIGIGGSQTIHDIGLHKVLMDRGNPVYWHWLADEKQRAEVLNKASNADIYLSSSNGITEDGKIVNIDGLGNRTSSLCFGHEKVYIIIGTNKISKNVSESINRIKTEACPKNAERLNLQTPCRYSHKCTDCRSQDRMCNITAIIEKKPMKADITICIINEKLGF